MKDAFRILVIGCGRIGEKHLAAFRATGRTGKLGACDSDQERLRRILAAGVGGEKIEGWTDVSAALDFPWDAVVVATPADSHLDLGRRVLDSGAALLVEKPLAHSPANVEHWIAMAEKKCRPIAVGHALRCSPVVLGLLEALRDNRIGKPLQTTIFRGTHLPSRWPAYAQSYYADRERGGGVIDDILCHSLDLATWLFGDARIIAADASHQFLSGVSVEDTVHVIARNGACMVVHAVNQYQHIPRFEIVVNGSEGTLRADLFNGVVSLAQDPERAAQTLFEGPADLDTCLRIQADVFLDAIAGRGEVRCTPSDALEILRQIGTVKCLSGTPNSARGRGMLS